MHVCAIDLQFSAEGCEWTSKARFSKKGSRRVATIERLPVPIPPTLAHQGRVLPEVKIRNHPRA
jgi:hypothetical protein